MLEEQEAYSNRFGRFIAIFDGGYSGFLQFVKIHRLFSFMVALILSAIFSIIAQVNGNFWLILTANLLIIFFAISSIGFYLKDFVPNLEYYSKRIAVLDRLQPVGMPRPPPVAEFGKLEDSIDQLEASLQKNLEVRNLHKEGMQEVFEKIDYEIDRIYSVLEKYLNIRDEINQFSAALDKSLEATASVLLQFSDVIDSSSGSVMEISNLLHSVAKQNKILSLNAEIEATKVGQLGKGFEVVANNVQKLAEQTNRLGNQLEEIGNAFAKNGKETSELVINNIEKVTERIRDVSKSVQNFSSLLDSLNRSLNRLDNLRNSLTQIDLR